jgi:hypothetical protein
MLERSKRQRELGRQLLYLNGEADIQAELPPVLLLVGVHTVDSAVSAYAMAWALYHPSATHSTLPVCLGTLPGHPAYHCLGTSSVATVAS